MNNTNK